MRAPDLTQQNLSLDKNPLTGYFLHPQMRCLILIFISLIQIGCINPNLRYDHGYAFYQKILSPADGARCGMYPTCSDYGFQAIQKHGPILGGWMAADRFMRDHGEAQENYTLISKFGRTRLWDPVSLNDFWFTK